MAKTTKTAPEQQPGAVTPDFSALIKQLGLEQQEQRSKTGAGAKRAPKPDPGREQEPRTVTVSPADIEPAERADEQTRERQERLRRARELVQADTAGADAADAEMDADGVLVGIDYARGGPQTQPDVERQIAVLQQAIEQGESIPVIARRYGVSRQAIQHYIAQAKEEIELNSQLLDIKLVESLDTKIKEIVLAVDKTKLDKATVRDLAIAAGIFLDKRRELLGPKTGTDNLRLRAHFRGEGAIELTTGE